MLFEFRAFLDCYDGYIARVRSHQVGMVQVSGVWGYYVDGVCDITGTVFFMVGLLIILKRSHLQRKVMIPLPWNFFSWSAKVNRLLKVPSKDFLLKHVELEKNENLLPVSQNKTRCTDKERPNGRLMCTQTCISIFCLSLLHVKLL